MTRRTQFLELAGSLAIASLRLTRTLQAFSRSADLSEPEISALAAVVHSKGVAARDLAGLEGVTPATISRLVATMETKGLVRRVRDDHDLRLQWITATTLGMRRIRDGHERRIAPLAGGIAALTDCERETLAAAVAILEDLVAGLQAGAEGG